MLLSFNSLSNDYDDLALGLGLATPFSHQTFNIQDSFFYIYTSQNNGLIQMPLINQPKQKHQQTKLAPAVSWINAVPS